MAIPCPLRRWNEKAREKMLVCLPLVGLAVGGIWLGLYLLMRHAAIGGLYAFLMAALPWLVTGFMHLDGYMDVCDAVLSRRELATRQRILKEPSPSSAWCCWPCASGAYSSPAAPAKACGGCC